MLSSWCWQAGHRGRAREEGTGGSKCPPGHSTGPFPPTQPHVPGAQAHSIRVPLMGKHRLSSPCLEL